MNEISGFDGNPLHLFEVTKADMSFNEAKEILYHRTLNLLKMQLEKSGPTFGLDIEKMAQTPASVLVKSVIEARKWKF